MASDFLRRKAAASAASVEKNVGKGAYGSTTYYEKKEEERKATAPKSYSDAVTMLRAQGDDYAAGIMTEHEWQRRRGKYGGTYQDYLYEATRKPEIYRRNIGFDTIDDDIAASSSMIDNAYNGWQDADTMSATKKRAESMKKRLSMYEEWRKEYGLGRGVDASGLLSYYESVLGDWDDLSAYYGQYGSKEQYEATMDGAGRLAGFFANNISTYNKRVEQGASEESIAKARRMAEDNLEMIKTKYPEYYAENAAVLEQMYYGTFSSSEIEQLRNADGNMSEIDKVYTTANSYEGRIQSLEKQKQNRINTWKHRSNGSVTANTSDIDKKIREAKAERDNYLKSVGYANFFAVEKEYNRKKNGVAYSLPDGSSVTWDELYNSALKNEIETAAKKNADFEGKSASQIKEIEYSYNGFSNKQTADNYDNVTYNIINGDKKAREFIISRYPVGTDTKVIEELKYDYLTDDERAVYNYIFETSDAKKASEYLSTLDAILHARRSKTEKEKAAAYASSDPIGASIQTILQKPLYATLEAIATVEDAIDNGRIDPNNSLYAVSRTNDQIRSTVEENINNPIGKFFYRHGMNLADNTAAMALGGFGAGGTASKIITTGVQSLGSFSSTVRDASERGLSGGEAIALGLISAGAETFFESKTFDSLFDGKTLKKSALSYLADNIKTELVGELSTEAVNDIADALIAEDLSNWQLSIDNYMAEGLSKDEALRETIWDWGKKYVDIAGGTLFSSGVMSGAPALGSTIADRSNKKTYGRSVSKMGNAAKVLDMAAAYPEDSSVGKLYKRYSDKGYFKDGAKQKPIVIGNLADRMMEGAYATLALEDATAEQKESASAIISQLESFAKTSEETPTTMYSFGENGKKQFEKFKSEVGSALDDEAIEGFSKFYEAGRNGLTLEQAQAANSYYLENFPKDAKSSGKGLLNSAFYSGQNDRDVSDNVKAKETYKADASEKKSTGIVFEKALDDYTPEKKKTIQDYPGAVSQKILDVARRFKANKNSTFERVNLGKVGEREAGDIKRLTGNDASGYIHAINSNALNHIEKRHGENGEHDNSMADLNDVARIEYVLDNYDTVELNYDSSGNVITSGEFRGKDNKPAPLLLYSKKIDGTYYAVAAVSENKYKKIWAVTAFTAKSKEGITQALNAELSALSSTSETSLASLPSSERSSGDAESSINSIAENGKDVKRKKEVERGNSRKGDTLEDSSIVLERDENKYPYDQREVIEGYEDAVDDRIMLLAEKIRKGQYKENDSVELGKTGSSEIQAVSKTLGIDVSGYDSVVEARQIRHIITRHGINGKADKSMRNDEDIARLKFVIDNYDDAFYGGTSSAYTTIKQNGKPREADTVVFAKKINGTYFVVQAVPQTKKKKLFVVSAFISDKPLDEIKEQFFNKKQKNRTSRDASLRQSSKTSVVTSEAAPSENSNDPGVQNQKKDSSSLVGTNSSADTSIPENGTVVKRKKEVGSFNDENGFTSVRKVVDKKHTKSYNESDRTITDSDYSSPEYETFDNHMPVAATDHRADRNRRARAAKRYGLSSQEERNLTDYVGGQMCYILNGRMRNGTLVDGDMKVVVGIRNALLKMPEFAGRTYRNFKFTSEKEYDTFLSQYREGNTVELKAFTSASKLPNGYPLFGKGVVHLVIDNASGRDIADTFGLSRQQEVVYLPGTVIEIKKVMIANDGNPLIFAQEASSNENNGTDNAGSNGNFRSAKSTFKDSDGQGDGSLGKGEDLSGLPGKARSEHGRDGVLSERRKGIEAGDALGEREQREKRNEHFRDKAEGSVGDKRSEAGGYKDLHRRGTFRERDGENTNGISEKVWDRGGGNGILSQRGESVDIGGVQVLSEKHEESARVRYSSVAAIKKATGFGDEGAQLVAERMHKGKSLDEAQKAVKPMYIAGFTGGDVKRAKTDIQKRAFDAGTSDKVAQREAARSKAKKATVRDGSLIENEASGKLSKVDREIIKTVAKDLGLSVSVAEKIVVARKNGVEYEADARHRDGELTLTGARPVFRLVLHEAGHRMEQFATEEWNTLCEALYERAEQLGRRMDLGVTDNLRFDRVKGLHDKAGITMDTSGYVGEIVMRELETIFSGAEEYNKWLSEISSDTKVKSAWRKFMDFVSGLIGKVRNALKNAGLSKDARAQMKSELAELERIRGLYAEAYRATKSAVEQRRKDGAEARESDTSGENVISYSIKDANNKKSSDGAETRNAVSGNLSITQKAIEALRLIGPKSINKFTSDDIKIAEPFARRMWKTLGTKSPFFRSWFGDWRANDKNTEIKIATIPEYIATNEARKKNRGLVRNTDTEWDINISRQGETNTISHSGKNKLSEFGLSGIRELIENAVLLDCEVHEHHNNNAVNDYISFDHKLYALGKSTNGSIALYKITVEEYFQSKTEPENKRFHNLRYIEKVADVGGRTFESSRSGGSTDDNSATMYSISDLFSLVKTYDKEFSPKEPSKVVNSDGEPMVVYHGTAEEFNIFDLSKSGSNFADLAEGMFFFTNKKEAYPNSASDYAENASRKTGKAPVVKEVYLDIKKPLKLDSRGYYQTNIYFDMNADDIYSKYFSGDYDGIIIENSDKTADDSILYLVDNSTQIKSATDNIGTFDRNNPDINYSIKEDGSTPSENTRELLDTIAQLKHEFEITKFAKADPKKLSEMVRSILKDYSSKADSEAVMSAVDELYTYMANGEDGNPPVWSEVYSKALDIASGIVENAVKVDDTVYREYADLRNYLRNVPMKFDVRRDGVPSGYGNFNEFRKKNFGRLRFSNDGVSVDSVYQELAEMYPQFFDKDNEITTADQLERIADVLDEIRPIESNPYAAEMKDATRYLANDILDRFFDIPQAKPTFADKAERRVLDAKIEGQRKVEKAKAQRDIKIQKLRDNYGRIIQNVKNEKTKALDKQKAKHNESLAKMSESRRTTEMRTRIFKHASELNQRLVRGTDNKHIPQELQGAVLILLESINLESNIEYVYGKDAMYHRVKRNTELGGESTKKTQAFNALRDIYSKLEGYVVIDPDMLGPDGILSEVINLADKRITDMTIPELNTVWKAIKAIEASVRSADKMFSAGKFRRVSDVAEGLRADNADKSAKKDLRYGAGLQKLIGLDMLTPETYFHYLGDTGDQIFRMMRDAQDKHISIMKEVADFTHEAMEGVNIKKLEKELKTVKLGGKEVTLTTAQLMELYTLMKRNQAKEHVFVGGILPDTIKGHGLHDIKAVEPVTGISQAEILDALMLLTEDQRKLADKLQEYASTVLGKYGNEASLQVYNYEKFHEKNYWPIRTNKQEISTDIEKDTAVSTVANKGMAKVTVPDANTSLRIGSIFDTFASHASDMATYAAWLGTTEDINRIRNFVFWEDGVRTGTVKGILGKVHGSRGAEYLQNLLADISVGVKSTNTMNPFEKLMGNYKAASIGSNFRVIIQQPTAILRAVDMMGAQWFAPAFVKNPLKGWDKAKKYAPIAQWKDWGYFDINTGRQMKDVLFDNASVGEKIKQFEMSGAGLADSISWGFLWNAVEAEIKSKHKELEVESEAYYKAVAERFTEVTDHTQVVDGILQRSQLMRSGDTITKMATSFMGEPTKQYNMVASALYDVINKPGKGKSKAIKHFGRMALALAISGVVNSAAQSIIDAMRDDDEEKKYWERWLAAFPENLKDTVNVVNYIPFVKDIVSIVQGYDVKRMDMETIAKTYKACENMIKSLKGEGKNTILESSLNLFAELARLGGYSVSNIKRMVTSIADTFAIETDNYLMQYHMEKAVLDINFAGNRSSFIDILYNAYNNDREAYEIIYNDLIENGITEKQIQSGMETRMKKAKGTTKTSDLEKRYMSPNNERRYDSKLKEIKESDAWKKANKDQQKNAEAALYDIIASPSDEMEKKRKEAAEYGVDETEYVLWQLAKSIADDSNDDNNSLNAKEKGEAIGMIPGLGDSEIAYFYGTEGADKAYEGGIDMRNYALFKGATAGLEGDGKRSAVVDKILEMGVDDDDAWDLYLTEYDNKNTDYARDNGIKGNTYLKFVATLCDVDKPTDAGKYGSYTQDEAKEAINSIPGLTREEKAILWQSVNPQWNAKNNPYR